MASRDYPRLGPVEFARQLIQTGDLDPIYVALNGSGFDRSQKLRWLCAYIAFYHAGVACWMSEREGPRFWGQMMVAAQNADPAPVEGRWPRSSERRHFRGQQAVAAIQDWMLRGRGTPETMFTYIAGCAAPGGGDTLERTMERAREYRSIGGWASLKCADLVDACLDARLEIDDITPLMYDSPIKGLNDMADAFGYAGAPGERHARVMDRLEDELRDLSPAHKPGRPVGPLEIETSLCKFHSHLAGHYPPGKDLREISHGLEPWARVCRSAEGFLAAMPRVVEGVI